MRIAGASSREGKVSDVLVLAATFSVSSLVPTIIYRILACPRAPDTSVCLSCSVQVCVSIADLLRCKYVGNSGLCRQVPEEWNQGFRGIGRYVRSPFADSDYSH